MRDEAAWLEWRRGGIGASEAPAILGVSEHGTRLAVYLDKIGVGKPRRRTEEQEWGLRFEDDIADGYHAKTGLRIVEFQRCVESPQYPWMRATIDGIREDGRDVEFKALGLFQANQWTVADGDWEALPNKFIVQVHHQMIVTETDVADVAVLIGLRLLTYTVPRSESLCRLIVDLTGELWDCVQSRTPPRTLDARDHELIELAYPRAVDDEYLVIEDPSFVDAADLYRVSKDKAAKVAVLDAMGDLTLAILPDGRRVTRKTKEVAAYTVPAKTRITIEVESPVHAHQNV